MRNIVAIASAAFAIGLGLASNAFASTSVTLGPAVQPHGAGRVTVLWMDRENLPVEVAATSPDNPTVRATSSVTAGVNAVELSGLVPGAEYSYSVGSRTGRFIAPPDSTQTLHFAVYGDSRTGDGVHRRLVSAVAAQRPDVVMTTGDDVENGDRIAQWQNFFAIERPLLETTAFTGVQGNHDVGALFSNLVRLGSDTGASRRTWGSMDLGPAHFLLVDGESPVTEGSAQYRFIERDLAANESKPLFVLIHKPLFSSGQHGGLGSGSIPSTLAPMFSRHGVDVVFQGHDHDYERTTPINGVTYVVTGGAGAPLYQMGRSPWTAVGETTHHFLTVDVSASRIRLVATRLDGSQLDSVTLDPRANNGRFTGTENVPAGGGAGCSVGPKGGRADALTLSMILLAYALVRWRTRGHSPTQ